METKWFPRGLLLCPHWLLTSCIQKDQTDIQGGERIFQRAIFPTEEDPEKCVFLKITFTPDI